MATPRRRTSVVGGMAPPPNMAAMGQMPAMGGRRQSAIAGGGRRASAVAPGMAGGMAAMMGGQSDLQTFNTFDRLLKESLRQSYFLGPDSYFMFWSCLVDEKLAIQFVTQLINSVVEIDELIETKKKPSKNKVKVKDEDEPSFPIGVPLEEVGTELFAGASDYRTAMKASRAALMSTIMFIASHFDIKASSASTDDAPMFEAIEAWKKRCEAAKVVGRSERASLTYGTFAASYVEDKASFSNDVDLMEALEAAVQVSCAKGLACPFQMPTDVINHNVGPSFSWHFITKLCTEGEVKRQEVFAALMDMLRVHNTEPRLLCLLHIFNVLLHSFSPWSPDQLRRLLPTLELFYFWPVPYGPMASDLASLIERELSCPGAAMRDRFMAEVPHVALACMSGDDSDSTYRVPVILDSGSANASFVKWVTHPEVASGPKPTARDGMVWFLTDMIRCACPDSPLAEEAIWALQDVPLGEITPLYEEACRIDIAAQEAGEQGSTQILARMTEIKNQLETQHGTNSPSLSIGSDPMTPRSRIRGAGAGLRGKAQPRREGVRRTSVTTGMAARGIRRASAAPMQMDIVASMDQGGYAPMAMGGDEMNLAMGFEHFELDTSHSGDYSYPTPKIESVGAMLRSIISSGEYVTGARIGQEDTPRKLKLCIAGGSRTLHAYVCAMVELKRSQSPTDAALILALEETPISVYLLPTCADHDDNTIGEFVARADGWYAKHILTTLSAPLPVVPQLREVKVPMMTVPPFNNKSSVLSPISATRNFVERYLRESEDCLTVKLFQCECWVEVVEHGQLPGPCAFSIPFCESVELGQTVCEKYQAAVAADGGHASPLLSASGSDIMFTFMRMGLTGDATMEDITAPPKSVKEAVLTNIARRDTPIAAADPTKPWMELDVIEAPSAKSDAIAWNEHVGSLEVEVAPRAGGGGGGMMSMFHVFVDGQPYGPFSRVSLLGTALYSLLAPSLRCALSICQHLEAYSFAFV